MKNNLPPLFFLFTTIFCSAQIQFEPGYFIDSTGKRTDCFIKNLDWMNNPIQFEYRLSQNAIVQQGTISNVMEFGIADYMRYERHRVKIDRSSDDTRKLTAISNPQFVEENLFLKLLIGGDASLYEYVDKDIRRFFFKKIESPVQPLIFKKYLGDGNKIGTNTQYRQQLLSALQCHDVTTFNINRLRYTRDDLIRYFSNYNSCLGKDFTIHKEPRVKGGNKLKFSLRAGFNYSDLSVNRDLSFPVDFVPNDVNIDFAGEIYLRLGFEIELKLPFNNNKWAIFLDPSYQNYSSETNFTQTFAGTVYESKAEVNYNTIESPVGVRHYFFLNNKSRLFLNASMALVFNMDSDIKFTPENQIGQIADLEVNGTEEYFSFGFGYSYIDKIQLELRYNTSRDLLGDNPDWKSSFGNNFSIIIGYSIL